MGSDVKHSGAAYSDWSDSINSDPIADLEAAFAECEASDTPEFLKRVMHNFREELLGPEPENDLSN
jgi:hypothetical protein